MAEEPEHTTHEPEQPQPTDAPSGESAAQEEPPLTEEGSPAAPVSAPEAAPAPAEPYVPPEPAPPGEPGMYWYNGDEPTVHPVLGTLTPGENDFTGWTHPDALQALGEAVASGLLEKVE